MRSIVLCLAIVFSPLLSPAAIEVAFIEVRGADGKILQLEKDGRFAHVAISYGGRWLHAHPYYGVVAASDAELARIGSIREIITISRIDSLADDVAVRYLGKPFDSFYSWDDERFYCSELVGKILAIPPQPMDFSSPVWPERYRKLNGLPGISPDKIYRALSARGYRSQAAGI